MAVLQYELSKLLLCSMPNLRMPHVCWCYVRMWSCTECDPNLVQLSTDA